MPEVPEDYLDKALSEYNEKVNALESGGDSEELLEAYVNRGCILGMMEHYTSALDDLETASDIESRIGSDDGTFVKMKTELGRLCSHFGIDPQDHYADAAARLEWIGPSSRHFDAKGVVTMCLDSAEILLEFSHTTDSIPFLKKAMDMTYGKMDPWMRNRRMETLNMVGETYDDAGDAELAEKYYGEAAEIGMDLMKTGRLEDVELLAATYMSKAECDLDMGMMDRFVEDSDKAILIIEKMHENGILNDMSEASDICHNVAAEFIKLGKVGEAEKYLMKAVKLTLKGAQEYMDRNVSDREDGQNGPSLDF